MPPSNAIAAKTGPRSLLDQARGKICELSVFRKVVPVSRSGRWSGALQLSGIGMSILEKRAQASFSNGGAGRLVPEKLGGVGVSEMDFDY